MNVWHKINEFILYLNNLKNDIIYVNKIYDFISNSNRCGINKSHG